MKTYYIVKRYMTDYNIYQLKMLFSFEDFFTKYVPIVK